MSTTGGMDTVREDIQNKVENVKDMMGKHSEKVVNQAIGNIQNQISAFGNQLEEYLDSIDADIQGYKFSVEKVDNGLNIDVLFKAKIKAQRESTKKE